MLIIPNVKCLKDNLLLCINKINVRLADVSRRMIVCKGRNLYYLCTVHPDLTSDFLMLHLELSVLFRIITIFYLNSWTSSQYLWRRSVTLYITFVYPPFKDVHCTYASVLNTSVGECTHCVEGDKL